jgi:hypothetical protein
MHDIEDEHNTQHQNAIKDVQKPFMAKYVPIISLDELHNSEHRPDQDENAGRVEGREMLAQRDAIRNGLRGGCFVDADLEENCNEDEATKEEDLKKQAADDDFLADFGGRWVFAVGGCGHESAA